jgi:hypothetical protein
MYIEMYKYICDPCNFFTNHKTDMTRHKYSRKHTDKERDIKHTKKTKQTNVSEVCPETVPPVNKKYICQYCTTSFTMPCNLARHHKKCKDKDQLVTKIKELEAKIEDMTIQLDETKQDKNTFKMIAVNTSEATKTSTNALSYVVRNYKNAPAIETFSNFSMLLEYDPKETVAKIAICQYRKKELTQYIGNILIKYYKKSNPDLQSLWNTDASRSSYIVREINIDKEVEWFTDKGGKKCSKYAVAPILEHIKEDCKNYIKDGRQLLIDGIGEDILNKMIASQNIINDIQNGELDKEIIKYIANYFHLDKKNMKQITM